MALISGQSQALESLLKTIDPLLGPRMLTSLVTQIFVYNN